MIEEKPNLRRLISEGWKDTGGLYNPETDVSDFEYEFKLRDR